MVCVGVCLQCDQSGKLLPSQRLYQGNQSVVYRQALVNMITGLTELMDGTNATDKALDIWDLDQQLALVCHTLASTWHSLTCDSIQL